MQAYFLCGQILSEAVMHQPLPSHAPAWERIKDSVPRRDLLCYWTVIELGMPMVDLAKKFDIRCQLCGSERREHGKGTRFSTGNP